MTPEAFKAARAELLLSAAELGRALSEAGPTPIDDRTVRRWEAGEREIPSSVATLIQRLVEEWRVARARAARVMATVIEPTIARNGGRPPAEPVVLTDFADADALARVKPDEPELTLSMQRALNRAMALALAERGLAHAVHTVEPAAYFRWLKAGGARNTPASRAEFAARHGKPRRYRLGLKLGARAIGWTALALDDVERGEDGSGAER